MCFGVDCVKTAACYIRVSTVDQTEYSPESQLRLIKDYAKKNNIQIKEEYIYRDEGISGRTAEKRPAFQKMILTAKVKPKLFDVILIYSTSRFARNLEDSIVYKSMLQKDCAIEVISITQPSVDKKTDMLTNAIYHVMDEWYSIDLADNVKRGMTQKALSGGHQSTAPFGYERKYKGANLTIVPAEAEVVQFIFNEVLESKKSFWFLAKTLNENGFRTKKNNYFDRQNLYYLLRNPVYKGYARWTPTGRTHYKFDNPDSIITKSNHEGIVSETIFNEVQKILDKMTLTDEKYKKPPESNKHWLSGILKCSACGSTLNHNTRGNPNHAAWQCRNYCLGSCTISHYLPVQKSENLLLTYFQNLSEQITLAYSKEISTENDSALEMNNINKEIKKLEKKRTRAKEGFLEGLFLLDDYKHIKLNVELEIDCLKKRYASLATRSLDSAPPKEKIMSIYDVLAGDFSHIEKNKVIRSIIEKIVFDKNTATLTIYFSL